MGHYISNVRDLEFNLFEVLGLDTILHTGAYGDLDGDTGRSMLAEAARLAEGPVADSYVASDRLPTTFDPGTHSVTLPESFKRSYRAWYDAQWWRMGITEAVGGIPAPAVMVWAINELVLGANPAVFLYLHGPALGHLLHRLGTPTQQRWAQLAVQQNWGSTMVLTEPDAGSDVGAARTRAIEQPDGSWHLEGVKRFITGGDADDLYSNIVHAVLARPVGAAPGTKGLSLFIVPKFLFDQETGELGDRNGVFVTNVEDKMGLKVSATCELTFGAHGIPAKGWLLGEVHQGIAQMFEVIADARMMVGTKAIATLSSGYLNALAYAKSRVQGADMARLADKTAPRVTITHHPDVRRSLAMQKAYAEGLRAIYLYAAAHQDELVAQQVSGADADLAARVNELLLPIVKGAGSERAYQCLTESLQCFGGSGYLRDYPIEQYLRDAKIDSVYEGTTAIQAQDFFFRKIARDRGVALAHLAGEIRKTVDSTVGNGRLKVEKTLLGTALDQVQQMTGRLTEQLLAAQHEPAEIYQIGLGSVRFLLAVGDLLIAWRLLVGAEIALVAVDSGTRERAFYEGKISVARFFAKHVLPGLAADLAVITDPDVELMQWDEAAF